MTSIRVAIHPTPVGDILIATGETGIVRLHPLHSPVDEEVARLAGDHDATVVVVAGKDAKKGKAERQLDEYFAGRRFSFDLPLDWSGVHGFRRAALEAVVQIPYGETAGYGEVAAMAGHPRAARAVGTACATTPFAIVVPVHRVVRTDGSLGQYGGHTEIKAQLLRLEQASAEQAGRGS